MVATKPTMSVSMELTCFPSTSTWTVAATMEQKHSTSLAGTGWLLAETPH